jgi:tetratricopeptide (TPR) repeat protein
MRNVALVEKYLGGAYEQVPDPASSLRHSQRALELDERRLAQRPASPQVRLDVAIDLANVAGALEDQRDYERATPLRTRSVQIRRALAADDPQNAQVGDRLTHAVNALAHVEALRGRFDKALRHSDEALRMARGAAGTNDSSALFNLAAALAVRGYIDEHRGQAVASCRAYGEANALLERVKPIDQTYVAVAGRGMAACRALAAGQRAR